ncbi:hypothetical protein Peur_020182 [Populus x canadensis]
MMYHPYNVYSCVFNNLFAVLLSVSVRTFRINSTLDICNLIACRRCALTKEPMIRPRKLLDPSSWSGVVFCLHKAGDSVPVLSGITRFGPRFLCYHLGSNPKGPMTSMF